MNIKSRIVKALVSAAALSASLWVNAQTYPEKTITVIVPFAAGGPTDTVARLIAQSMGNTLKQQLIIENAGGAGGTIGAARASQLPTATPCSCTTSASPPRRRCTES